MADFDVAERWLPDVPRPRPRLDRERERRLTDRQRELLDQMEALFAQGFADLTMAELAARLNCSLRTLYELAPSRDELVLVVVDRSLWRTGRAALEAIDPELPPLEAVRAYLEAATVAVGGWTEAFSRDLWAVPAARQLEGGHGEYVAGVVRALLDAAVERGDVPPDIDTGAVARAIAGLGRFFARPTVISTIRSSPKDAADQVVDLVLRGLQAAAQKGAR
jgi:AcrR family transcriptional regulator